ncbi:MAG TPA: PIG-L deacetylase family protein [Acidimicrobiales bacterium]|nr:PIG-L deacetylase family protein [Acidimicrobiales bacterium]
MTEATAVDDEDGAAEANEAVVVPLDPSSSALEAGDPDPLPERVLVVAAHPDDADFGASGTIASWAAQGASVTYCIVTDGAAGAADPGIDLANLASIRQGEQRRAAEALGVEDVIFLGYADGRLEPSQEVRRDVSRVIRHVRPDRVVAQSPERDYRRIRASHPDHLAAGEATLRAVYPDARNPYAHPELLAAGLEPFEVPEVWLMASTNPDRVVDITGHFEEKVAALSAHASQITDITSVASFVREWAAETARRFGLPPGRLAEAFQVVDTR